MSRAWIVNCLDEWCTLMHADTRGKAIHQARTRVDAEYDFTCFRAKRLPELDDKPFDWGACVRAGFEYFYDGEPIKANEFVNDCRCDICRGLPGMGA